MLFRALRPDRAYYLYGAGSSFFLVLALTLSQVYYVTVVGLDALQMVLVGTVVEATCFLFEVPTGVVADVYSRRLSVVLGLVLSGAAMLLQGLSPTFGAVLGAQVVWGIGLTLTSGADQAWVTDEVGEDAVGHVFTREQQLALALTFAGTLLAGMAALAGLRVPMLFGGAGLVGLAAALAVAMPERHFHRTPRNRRETLRHMASTAREGFAIARRRPVVRSILLVSLFVGLSSEAFDRLWQVRVLADFHLPPLFGVPGPVGWFTGFALAGTLVSLGVSLVVNRVAPGLASREHPNRVLAVLVGLQVCFVAVVALGGQLLLVLGAVWGRDAGNVLAGPLRSAWLNRNLEPRTRATVISMNGQVDAIGQVAGGPPLGALASRTSTSTALLVSTLVLAPAALVYARTRLGREQDGERGVAGTAVELDAAAVGLRDGRHDREAESGAPGGPVA